MKRLTKSFILIAALFSMIGTASADSKTVTTVSIPLKADFKPTKVLGLIIAKKDVKQVPNAQIDQVGPNEYIVSFAVDKAKTPLTTTLSAIAFSEDEKQSVFSDVKAFGNVMIPPAKEECISADKEKITAKVKSISMQKRLISIREERRVNQRNEFLAVFDQKTLTKLYSLSTALGIPTEPAFDSEELHPADLVDRLSRLEHALLNYLAGRAVIEGKRD